MVAFRIACATLSSMDAVDEYHHRAKFQRGSMATRGWVMGLLLLWMAVAAERTAAKEHPLGETPTTEAARATTSTSLLYGKITVLNLTGPASSLTLTTTEGKITVLSVDSQLTTVWSLTQLDRLKIEQLKVGQQVKVHYSQKGEKQFADAILILEEPPKVNPPAQSTPATPAATASPPAPPTATSHANKKAKSH